MKGIGDFFVRLFAASIGLVLAAITVVYAINKSLFGAAWLASVSLLSSILLVVLSVQEIRIFLNLVFSQVYRTKNAEVFTDIEAKNENKNENYNAPSEGGSLSLNLGVRYSLSEKNMEFQDDQGSDSASTDAGDATPLSEGKTTSKPNSTDKPNASADLTNALTAITTENSTAAESLPLHFVQRQNSNPNSEIYQYFEVVRKSKDQKSGDQLDMIEDVYKKMKPYLSGQRGLIIIGVTQARGPFATTLRQVLNGDKATDQLICKNIYPDLDLLADTEVNFIIDKIGVENMLVALWSDYYRIVILIEEWEEEFWRAVGRNVNDRVSLGQNHEWLTVPAIKRKRPISYQRLSRFEMFNSRNID